MSKLNNQSIKNQEVMKELEKKLEELFDNLVPPTGPAETKGGEIVRAFSRIRYRFYNDGDVIGDGYGRETVNPAARFLLEKLPLPKHLFSMIEEAIGTGYLFGIEYEKLLDELMEIVVDYVTNDDSCKEKNEEDMFDYKEPQDVEDYDEYDHDYDDEDY